MFRARLGKCVVRPLGAGISPLALVWKFLIWTIGSVGKRLNTYFVMINAVGDVVMKIHISHSIQKLFLPPWQ